MHDLCTNCMRAGGCLGEGTDSHNLSSDLRTHVYAYVHTVNKQTNNKNLKISLKWLKSYSLAFGLSFLEEEFCT